MILVSLTDKNIIKQLLQKDNIEKSLGSNINLNYQQWFGVIKNQELIGLFIVTPGICNTLYYHGAIYKQFRGKETKNLLVECLNLYAPKNDVIWMTTIPERNRHAIKLAERMGLEYKTTINGGYLNDNMLIYSEV